MRRGPINQIVSFFFFPSFLKHGFPACHIMPCYFSTSFQKETHLNLLAGNEGRFPPFFFKTTFFYYVVQSIFDLTWLSSGMTHGVGFGQSCS